MIQKIYNLFIGNWSTSKTTIIKNTAWLTGAELGSRVLRGVLSLVAARMLGAEGLGVFSYAIALGGFITFFEDAGIGTYVTRSIAQKDSHQSQVIGTALVLKLLLAFVACGAFLSIGPLVSSIHEAVYLIPVVAVLIFADSIRGFLYAITRGQERMHLDATVQIATNIAIAVLGIVFILMHPSPLFLAIGYALGSIAGALGMYWVVRSHIPNLKISFSKTLFKEIFFAAWPFTLLAISNVLIFNTDSLFIGHYGTATDVGLYGAASRLVMMFYILSSLFSVATFPVLVQKISQGESIAQPIRKSLLLMTAVALPLIIIMTFGSGSIISLLFGASFIEAAPMLAILSLTYIPVFTRSMLNNAILAKNIQNQFVVANIAGVVVNIGLDYLLVPHYLGVGAAVASVAGLSTISIITAYKMYYRQPAK